MKRSVHILLTVLLMSACTRAKAQEPSNKGTDFWVGYGHHMFMEPIKSPMDPALRNTQNLVLYFSAEEDADVTVTVNNTTWTRSYHVAAHTVLASDDMPKGNDATEVDCRLYTEGPGFNSEGLFANHAIHIHSSKPIVAYAHGIASGSSGATMLMPVNTWGYSYLSLNSNQLGSLFSWTYVVASHDNTRVEITPGAKTRNGKAAGQAFYATLNAGEIYQVLGDEGQLGPNGGGGVEMSGTRIRSIDNGTGKCYPVAVYSGSDGTVDSMSCGYGFTEADMQQVFPTHAWGKRYLTAPTSREDKPAFMVVNAYKVLVNDVSTIVKVNGKTLTGLKKNYYYFESNTADVIEADKPVMVAQFIPGGRVGSCNSGNPNTDPDIIYLSPLAQGINKIGFYRNNREDIVTNYLTLIVPNKGTGLSSLRIDGASVTGLPSTQYYTYTHPKMPDYSVVVRRWTGFAPAPATPPGQCLVSCDSAFTAITYGLGPAESYAYNAGTHIYNLDALSSLHNTLSASSQPNVFTCVDAPVTISALVAYKPTQIAWGLSALAGTVVPAVDVTDNAPLMVETVEVHGGIFYKYTLAGTYRFNKADTFYLPVTFTSMEVENCEHKEEILLKIIVKDKPRVDYAFARNTNCSLDTVHFTGTDKSIDGYTLQTWDWTFPDGKTADGIKAAHLLAPGADQPVVLSAVTQEGCVADTVKQIVVYAPPKASFTASPAAVCENGAYSYTGTATYEGSGSLQWYWILGNGNTQTTTINSTSPAVYKQAGEHIVQLVVKAGEFCISDTIKKTVVVYGAPKVDIVYPEGCLPKDGKVTFTNKTSAAEGQTITSHLWNFGDADATPDNPNTSTAAGPSHSYSKYGDYSISYRAQSSKGCITDTVIKAKFNLAPTFSFPALTPVCENAAAVSVAKASVTNNVPYTAIYKGPGTTPEGMFTPALAGAGVDTVWFVCTATSGCVDSIKQTIEVYPQPVAAYNFTNNTCVGDAVTFTSTATVAGSDAISRWSWNLGDNNKPEKTTDAAFDHPYAAYGSYDVVLTVTSNHNCVSKPVTQTVVVRPLPVADFAVPEAICLPGGAAIFTNKSTIALNGTLNYSWDFGDGTGTSTAVNPSHVYAAGGSYNVQLSAVSAYGCRSAASNKADKFSERPLAAFTASSLEICQGAEIAFTDASTATGSTVKSWEWSFGDGAIVSTRNVVKKYSQPGSFQASLVVKNALGCASLAASKPVKVHPKPVIDAGNSFMVKEGDRVQFTAIASGGTYTYQWYPVNGLSNPAVLQPYLTALQDITYILTATGEANCTATDSLTVKIVKDIAPPNAFTPNGDGVHDVWEIPYLSAYTNAVVDVFNRYGQNVYHNQGYSIPWNGRINGKDLPAGTYYYIINLGTGAKPLTGSVTIIR